MEIPYFFEENISKVENRFQLSEDTSHHCVTVLRMKRGDEILLTNGTGGLFSAVIEKADKKNSMISITSLKQFPSTERKVSIAISPLKNPGRMEWFLEKATEIGVKEIRLLNCDRTERSFFKADRFKHILTGALIQSRQTFLPRLHAPENFATGIKNGDYQQKMIAHCREGEKINLIDLHLHSTIQILIGPEGDFSDREIDLAINSGYQPVSLGNNRLRTETAGIVAAALLVMGITD